MSSRFVRAASLERLRAVYAAGSVSSSSAKSRAEPANQLDNKIAIWQGDITTLQADAIVNAANRSLLGGGGVDGAIHRAAGPRLLEACKKLNGCATGDAKITKGYDLPSGHVMHAVGPVYRSQSKGESAEQLRRCYQRCLELMTQHHLTTIAFNCISIRLCATAPTLGGSLLTCPDPIRDATEIALETVRDYLLSDAGQELDLVVFCTFSERDFRIYHELAPRFFPPSSSDE